ncbi:TRAP transporter large permease [Marispirochaeta sp.]|jgi:C4-dicarboxylate transporter, DctM subunit|uniref:TRAP transporter large permease n=1 Tax=Marispirochaeta sp. TaxID=2038653 RepID=UPI0029C8C024|nr:TRAP transporter large permease [Marispirochaeta sp.]
MLTLLIFIVLLVLILLNIPIAVAMGVTAIIFFVGLGQGSSLTMLAQRMYYGTTGFTLLAVPFFILAGNLMNSGGITNRIFRFARALVGHIPGGLGQVSVISSVIFSGMSGSAVADAAGLGQIEQKAMIDDGYDPVVAASMVASSSIIGPIIPPSIPFVFFGALTAVSVPRLFMAGFIPGFIMAAAMMMIIAVMAKPRGFPRSKRAGLKELLLSFTSAFFPLMTPVIIIGGILSGLFTPTEASVVACIYAIILGFIYKDLKVRDLPGIFWDTIKASAGLLFIMAVANFFGWFVMYQQIPNKLIASLAAVGASGSGVMAIIIAVVLILGLFMEGNAILFITIPIFLPIVTMYGFDLINLGVVLTLLIMVGNLTPPVGMCLFAVAGHAHVPILKLGKECLPYVIGALIITIIMAYVPQISTFLPNLIMGIE